MDGHYLISVSPIYAGKAWDFKRSLEKSCPGLKKIWMNPWNQDHAVLLSSTPREHLMGLPHSQINSQNEEETDSIIVVVESASCYGLKDKVSLLFQWKRNGGDLIHETKKIGDDVFQITFTNGWHAVKEVCSNSWKIDDDTCLKIIVVVPFFKSFQNINDSASKNNDSQDTDDVYQEIDDVGCQEPLSHPSNSPAEVENQQESLRRKRHECNVDKIREEYLERFNPEKLQSMKNGQHFKNKTHFNTIANLGPIIQRPYTLPFPCVTDFLFQEGEGIRRKIEDEHKCLIKETSGQRDTGRINFSVTLLVTTTLEKSTIHLIQGNSRKIKADTYFHIQDYEYGTLKRNLSHFSRQDISSLAISVSSRIADECFLDEFAFWIVSNLKHFFGNKSKMHIFLCEYKNSALVEAYKYTLLSLQNKKQFDPIDLPMWKKISEKNFYPPFNELKSKVHVLSYFPNNFSHGTTTFICLPILQNLDHHSCPYSGLSIPSINIEKLFSSLKYTMTEEDLFNFSTGQIHKLKIPSYQDIVIAVYCSQVWDFGVAKSIEYSLNNCLEIKADGWNRVAYICPPGICPGYQYPVEFTVQKCLQALHKKIDTLKKFTSVNLVVPDKRFYDSFDKILNKKPKKSANDVLCDPESSVLITGLQDRNIDTTKETLVTKLKKRMEQNSVQKEPINLEQFKKKIQASPPEYVQVTVKRQKVRVAGLRTCDVDLFLKEYEYLFRRQQPLRSPPSSSRPLPPIPPESQERKERVVYKWKRLSSSDCQIEEFKDKMNDLIEGEFKKMSDDEIELHDWSFNFSQMTCKRHHNEFFLLRNEMFTGIPHPDKKTLLQTDAGDEHYKTVSDMLKHHVDFNGLKVQVINSEKRKAYFAIKESTKSFKKKKNFWHRIIPEVQKYILAHGFQKAFSYCPPQAVAKNLCTFYKDPSKLCSEKELSDESEICLLLCDVLYDENGINADESKFIGLEFTDLSDAQILLKYICTVRFRHIPSLKSTPM